MFLESPWQPIKKLLKMIIGCGLLAFAVKCIYDPCGMVVGGFSGLSVLIKHVTEPFIQGGVPLGITTFVLNIPVFLIAYPVKGKSFIEKTLLATVILSVWLEILPELNVVKGDMVLSALFGGLTGGSGIGLVLTTGSTTGGTDMIGSLIQRKFPEYSVAQIMAVLDGIIILAGAYVFGMQSALYALVAVYVATKASDMIVVGLGDARSMFIITDKPEEVADVVFKEVDRGVTGLNARGMYTGNDKTMLFTAVTKKEIVRLKECIFRVDDKAFVIVSDAKEVHGEGFRHIEQTNIG